MSDQFGLPSEPSPAVRKGRGELVGRIVIGPLAALLLFVMLVFYVFFTAHAVEGDSMVPGLRQGDRTLVTKGYEVPARGDVIIFASVNEHGASEDLVKRVVAIPGDSVSVQGGVATVNGRAEDTRGYIPDPADPVVVSDVTVPEGHVFVLGDNRPVSLDSRRIGFIPMTAVSGAARFIWAPIGRIGVVR